FRRGGRRLAAHARYAHAVRAFLLETDRIEARGDVRVQVAGPLDLVEELRGDGPDRDESAGAGVLGHDEGAVGMHLGDRKTDPRDVGHLAEEGIVAAG